jgi:hypothetical protein
MPRLTTITLRSLLVILFLAAVSAQAWFIPQLARDIAAAEPQLAYLAPGYVILWFAVAACAQVALVAVWMLLGKVRRGAIFSESSYLWVNAIIGAALLATALVAAFEFHLLGIVDAGEPPLGILLSGMVVAGAAFTLVLVVMRGLLRQATQLQTELAEVV